VSWREEVCPNDLGDGNHRWSWLVRAGISREDFPPAVRNFIPTNMDLLWGHQCIERWVLCWIDLTTGTKHFLVSADPLTISPSVLCPIGCGDHGFIRDDLWVVA